MNEGIKRNIIYTFNHYTEIIAVSIMIVVI